MSYRSFYLLEMPRLLNRPFRLRSVAWMPDHLHWNRNRTITLPHFCYSFHRERGPGKSLVNGVLREKNDSMPYFSVIPVGTRLHTLIPRRHDELMFTLVPEDFEPVMKMIHPISGTFCMNHHIERLLHEILENMEQMYVPGAADRMDGLFLRLLEETVLAILLMTERSPKDDLIYEIISYLNDHFMDPITLRELCRKYGISLRSLYRRWHRCFDHTPAEFLLRKRLRFADQLLLSSDLSVQTVAAKSGFGNPVYFTQCFRHAFGMSPTRRRISAGESSIRDFPV